METRVKERLTGALILVALLVIVVPEMLSGPDVPPAAQPDQEAADDGPPLRSYTMELGGKQSDQSALTPQTMAQAVTEAPAAPASTSAPAPAAPAPAPTPPPATAASTPAAPAATPAPAPAPAAAESRAPTRPSSPPAAPAPTPAAGSNAWWVQVGSFSQTANADRVVKELGAAGIAARVSAVRSNGKELFRVRAGPVNDRAAAEALRSRLAAAGHKGTIVPP